MLKDKPKEPAAKRAERRWKNHDVSTRFKAEKAATEAAPPKPRKPLLIETERRKPDAVTRFENRFKKEIRAMLDGYKQRNAALYLAGLQVSLRHQKRVLLLEKLRRLEAGVATQEASK